MKLLRNFFSTLISIRDRYVKLSKVDNEIVFFFLPEFKNIIELLVQIMISSISILCFTYILELCSFFSCNIFKTVPR